MATWEPELKKRVKDRTKATVAPQLTKKIKNESALYQQVARAAP
jgi:hypothetical protein